MKTIASGGCRPKVVVVGGFGGVNVTRKLAKADVDVTVVDRTNHHLFQPLLYQVATGIMPEGLIAPALRRVVRGQANTKVVLGEVRELDLAGRRVSVVARTARRWSFRTTFLSSQPVRRMPTSATTSGPPMRRA